MPENVELDLVVELRILKRDLSLAMLLLCDIANAAVGAPVIRLVAEAACDYDHSTQISDDER